MTIEHFDPAALRLLRADLDAALATVAEKHGITIQSKHITYSSGSAKITVEAETAKGAALTMSLATMIATRLGIDISGMSVNGQYKVVGYNAKRRSKPWELEANGKSYSAPDDWMRTAFPATVAQPQNAPPATDLIQPAPAGIEIKFLPRDFVGGRMPSRVGAIATVGHFMGQNNVPVRITQAGAGFVMATLEGAQ